MRQGRIAIEQADNREPGAELAKVNPSASADGHDRPARVLHLIAGVGVNERLEPTVRHAQDVFNSYVDLVAR